MSMRDLRAKLVLEGDATGAATAAEKTREALTGAGASAKTAGERIESAFGAVGVRSAAQITVEILRVNQSLDTLAREAKVTGAEFDRAWGAGQARIAQLRAEMIGSVQPMNAMQAGARGLGDDFGALLGPLAAVGASLAGGKAFIDANAQAQSLSRTLVQLTGSSEAAAAELEYIRTASNRLGVDVQDASKSYTQLIAATKGTALEGDAARRVFEAVAGAMASLGKGSAETNNALMAVNQMVSKGTVQMEELKGQLGEALPGAMKAAANGAGLTVAELTKMVESGNVLAEDLLPAMAKGLEEMYGVGKADVDTFSANWARLKNSVTETMQVLGDSGLFKGLTEGLEVAAKGVATLSAGFVAAGQKIGVMVAAIANGDLGLSGWSERTRQALGEIDAKTVETLAKISGAGKATAAGLGEAGKAAEEAGKKAKEASGNWLQVGHAYDEVESASKKQIETLKVQASAADAGAAAMKSFTDTFGTQVEKLDAATNAAKEHEAALRKISDQVRADVEISRARLASLEQERGADGKLTEAKEKQREELQKTIVAKQAEAEKTAQATAAAHAATMKAEAATLVYADHARQVNALRDAWQSAEAEYQRLSTLNAKGINVAKELQAADEARAKALLLYRDALADATAAAERQVTAEQSAANLQRSALQNDLYRASTILEVARQRGNEKDIAEAQIAVWRIELQINEAQAEAARLESQAMALVAAAKRAELEASGELTEAKKAELAVMDASVKAKQLEAEKYDLVADRMKSLAYETKELKSSFGELSSATDEAAAAADRAAGSYTGLASSIKGAAAAKDSFTRDGAGNVVSASSVDAKTVAERLKGLGVDQTVADRESRQFFDGYGNVQNTYGRTLDEAVQVLAERLSGKGRQTSGVQVQTVKVVQVDLRTNGGIASVKVLGQQGADALVRALEEARGATF